MKLKTGEVVAEITDEPMDVRAIVQEIIEVLRGKNGKPISRELALAIEKLQEATYWLAQAYFDETPIAGKGIWFSSTASDIPCALCGGIVYEFSIASDLWNRVIRPDGQETDKEYLCITCFLGALRRELGIANS